MRQRDGSDRKDVIQFSGRKKNAWFWHTPLLITSYSIVYVPNGHMKGHIKVQYMLHILILVQKFKWQDWLFPYNSIYESETTQVIFCSIRSCYYMRFWLITSNTSPKSKCSFRDFFQKGQFCYLRNVNIYLHNNTN